MKKRFLIRVLALVIAVMLLSGCGALGIAKQGEVATVQGEVAAVQGELTAARSKIESLEKQVVLLSTISAYNVWYDQYYARGTYLFASVNSFNEKLGSLIGANGKGPSGESWEKYLVADKTLSDLIATLPEDTQTWSADQYDSWYKASSARYTALGAVGTALFSSIAQ